MQLKVWKLGENDPVQVVSFQSEALRIVKRLVNELTLLFVDHVVVADQLLVPLRLAHLVRLLRYAAGDEGVTDSYESFLYEIHLIHFLILVVNYLIVNVVLKLSGQKALRDFIQQADILLLVALRVVEEALECRYHVLEQEVDCDLHFSFIWHVFET